MYYVAKFLSNVCGFGRAIDVRIIENNGLYRMQRLQKYLGHTWWESIPHFMHYLETEDKAQAEQWLADFKMELKRERNEWKVVEGK